MGDILKILQIIPYYAPAWSFGGTVRVAYEISKRLAERGHYVVVYTSDFLDPYTRGNYSERVEFVDGVEVHYFRNLSLGLYRLTKLSITPSMIRNLKGGIDSFDIVHLHQYRSFQNIVTLYYASKHSVPCILEPHGSIGRVVEKQNCKKLFDFVFGSSILEKINTVIALTDSEAKVCKDMGIDEERVTIVPNGINLNRYKMLDNGAVFREKYLISPHERIILYIGRIHASKGIDLLVDAFAALLKEMDDIRLVLIGPDDGDLSSLKKKISELGIGSKINYLGYVSENDKISAYLDSDVFVTPSFYGFPMTFLEVMACGTPIITTDKGDTINDIDGNVGLVVTYDKIELKNALYRLLSDNKLYTLYRNNCLDTCKKYDWDVIVDIIEKIYIKNKK